jgi:hypothetical protein
MHAILTRQMASDAPFADALWYSLCPSVGTYVQLAAAV